MVGPEKEVSLDQFTKWLKEYGRLKQATITADFFDLLEELERDVDLLCKQKRKKTTSQYIEEILKEEHVKIT